MNQTIELLAYKGLLYEVEGSLKRMLIMDAELKRQLKEGFYKTPEEIKGATNLSIRAASQIEQAELLIESYKEKIEELSKKV